MSWAIASSACCQYDARPEEYARDAVNNFFEYGLGQSIRMPYEVDTLPTAPAISTEAGWHRADFVILGYF